MFINILKINPSSVVTRRPITRLWSVPQFRPTFRSVAKTSRKETSSLIRCYELPDLSPNTTRGKKFPNSDTFLFLSVIQCRELQIMSRRNTRTGLVWQTTEKKFHIVTPELTSKLINSVEQPVLTRCNSHGGRGEIHKPKSRKRPYIQVGFCQICFYYIKKSSLWHRCVFLFLRATQYACGLFIYLLRNNSIRKELVAKLKQLETNMSSGRKREYHFKNILNAQTILPI